MFAEIGTIPTCSLNTLIQGETGLISPLKY